MVTGARGRKRLTVVGDFQTTGCLLFGHLPSAAFAGCMRGQLVSVLGCQVLGGMADLNRTLLKPQSMLTNDK